MPVNAINMELYYGLQNRMNRFNKIYGERIKNTIGEQYLLNMDIFQDLRDTWSEIAHDETGDYNIDNLPADHHISEASLEKLIEQGITKVYNHLAYVAEKAKLGEVDVNEHGIENVDYTYISGEIVELGVLALHVFTNVYKQLDNVDRDRVIGVGSHVAHDRAERLAEAWFYQKNGLSKMGMDQMANIYISRSMRNQFTEIYEKIYVNEEMATNHFSTYDFEKKTPYRKVKARRDARIEKEIADKKQKKIDDAKRMEENAQRRMEEERKYEEEHKREIDKNKLEENEKEYEERKIQFDRYEDVANPQGVDAVFYTYFNKFAERMGIDKAELNAQSILNAASVAFMKDRVLDQMNQKAFDDPRFKRDLQVVFQQVQHVTYQSYISKCVSENTEIDLTVPARETADLMGTLMYTLYPRAFYMENGKRDQEFVSRLHQILKNNYAANEMHVDEIIAHDAFKQAKEAYRLQDPAIINKEGDERYEGFASKWSSDIIKETASVVDAYAELKSARESGAEYTNIQERNLKKEALDAAYALEKRFETRYATGIARFFRYFPYSNEKAELARVKAILGIDPEKRVADCMADIRANDIFVDIGDRAKFNKEREAYSSGLNAEQNVLNNIKKYVDNVPEVSRAEFQDEIYKRTKIYSAIVYNDDYNYDMDQLQKIDYLSEEEKQLTNAQREERRKQKEEEARLKAEAEERIRKEKEEEERRKADEEERRFKEEEEREQREREEKERQRLEEERKKKEEEERLRKEEEERKQREKEERIKAFEEERKNDLMQKEAEFKEAEKNSYNTYLQNLQNLKTEADEKYEQLRKADEESRSANQKELDDTKQRLEQLRTDAVLSKEESATKMSQNKRLQNDTRDQLKNLKDKLATKDGPFKSLVKAKEKEEAKNQKIKDEKNRIHTASRELEVAIQKHPEVYKLSEMIKTLEKEERDTLGDIFNMEYEISELEKKLPGLEKEVNRVNHDLELAHEEKKYADKALDFYVKNKEDLMSKYASDEVGQRLYNHRPYELEEFKEPQLYDKNISEIELDSDPDPMKYHRDMWEKLSKNYY